MDIKYRYIYVFTRCFYIFLASITLSSFANDKTPRLCDCLFPPRILILHFTAYLACILRPCCLVLRS
ncbi:hypothetical protein BGW80DRAFT_1277419 [Lactifluus volemus]|nr:hypothetical protein BGW80DRAFT_1277419 [Lactifluus volemus]